MKIKMHRRTEKEPILVTVLAMVVRKKLNCGQILLSLKILRTLKVRKTKATALIYSLVSLEIPSYLRIQMTKSKMLKIIMKKSNTLDLSRKYEIHPIAINLIIISVTKMAQKQRFVSSMTD